jgi:hypothetical protein
VPESERREREKERERERDAVEAEKVQQPKEFPAPGVPSRLKWSEASFFSPFSHSPLIRRGSCPFTQSINATEAVIFLSTVGGKFKGREENKTNQPLKSFSYCT